MSVEVELRAARVRYGPLEALHGVDLAFPAGRVTVLIGRNGSGRTTALRALAGVVPLAAGRCLWEGTDVSTMPAYRRARLGLAFVPAEHAVFGSLTVAENLGLAARADAGARTGGPTGARTGAPTEARTGGPTGARTGGPTEARTGGPTEASTEPPTPADLISTFPELPPLFDRRAETLSGGQQQLVALCRALLRRPRLLILDEPDRGLAPAVVARMHRRLLQIAAEGRTVVLAAQTLPPTLGAAGVVHVLHRGRVAFSGEPGELPLSE